MKTNEVVGLIGTTGVVSVLLSGIGGHNFTSLHLVLEVIFLLWQTVFWSVWGLTTFNSWVGRLTGKKGV